MFFLKKKIKKGFTLTELLAVLAIVSIMSLIGFSFFNNFQSATALNLSQRKLAAAMKLAQSFAIQGRTQQIFGGQRLPCGYGLRFISKTEFEIFYNEPENNSTTCADTNKVSDNLDYEESISKTEESFILEKGVEANWDVSANEKALYFSIPDATVYENGSALGSGEEIYDLVYTKTSENQSVMVNGRGGIFEIKQ